MFCIGGEMIHKTKNLNPNEFYSTRTIVTC